MKISVAVLMFLVLSAAPAFAAMTGSYEDRNVTSSARLAIAVDKDGHVTGKLSMPDGKNYLLNGEQLGTSAQGALNAPDGVLRAFFFAEQAASGVSLQFIPQGKDKKPDLAQATLYAFVPLGTPRASEQANELRSSVVEEDAAPKTAKPRLPIKAPNR